PDKTGRHSSSPACVGCSDLKCMAGNCQIAVIQRTLASSKRASVQATTKSAQGLTRRKAKACVCAIGQRRRIGCDGGNGRRGISIISYLVCASCGREKRVLDTLDSLLRIRNPCSIERDGG